MNLQLFLSMPGVQVPRTCWSLVLILSAVVALTDASAASSAKARWVELRDLLWREDGSAETLERASAIHLEMMAAAPESGYTYVGTAMVVLSRGYRRGFEYDPMALTLANLALDRALAKDPDLLPALLHKARVAAFAGELGESRRWLERATVLEPESPEVIIQSAWQEFFEEDYDEAIAKARSAGKVEGFYLQHRQTELMALSLDRLGQHEDALVHRRRLLELRPQSAWTHGNLASALVDAGKYEEAFETAQQALKLGDYPMGRFTLARAAAHLAHQLLADDAVDSAQRYAEVAVRFAPRYFYGVTVFGNVYERLAQFAPTLARHKEYRAIAERAYARALKLRPEDEGAQAALERVRDWHYRF